MDPQIFYDLFIIKIEIKSLTRYNLIRYLKFSSRVILKRKDADNIKIESMIFKKRLFSL